MTDTDIDHVDLTICDLIAYLKGYNISLACALEIITERTVELYPEVEPAPSIH